MDMIWHAVNGNHFMFVVLNYGRYVFIQFFLPGVLYEIISAFNGKYQLNI